MRSGRMTVIKICRSLFHTSGVLGQSKNLKIKSAKEVVKLMNSSDKPNIRENKDDRDKPTWQKQVLALKRKFKGEKWNPSKKVSREEMESMRLLKNQFPQITARELSARYKVSPEAIRRVLKSKWQPSERESIRLHERWKRRGVRIKEMYEQSSEQSPLFQNLPLPKRISISSARSSPDFVLRNIKPRDATKKLPKTDKAAAPRNKGKLFLLKDSLRQNK
ncbi:hypothetical protein HG535_0G01060 [Zygotorulaspora mrakii]|uniref:Required for respiratory growth protein 9, mitochondrial n=1 Tax=Zygotorulaspora mrakii TaxID=42260 RepID=A0A7H9B904_ZYGMR|nr:uncharacterized protein HG535_0G01060 [Zygotorulaspora mrakii]QLG74222.1 hypothetical protein HG535_0G01060 [Zygotorulaspora mrakii]